MFTSNLNTTHLTLTCVSNNQKQEALMLHGTSKNECDACEIALSGNIILTSPALNFSDNYFDSESRKTIEASLREFFDELLTIIDIKLDEPIETEV